MLTTRPLGELSNFVVEELPEQLVQDHTVIPSRVVPLLFSMVADGSLVKSYFLNRDLALLDLKFCEVAMIRKGLEVPQILTHSVDFFCGNLNIPGLQYHELVELNPVDDIRTFTNGEIGKTEALFYDSHRFVEARLSRLVSVTEDFLDPNKKSNQLFTDYKELLDFAAIRPAMTDLREMMPGHFPAFRPFISDPCPVRQFDGPSGAYSWRIPYLELLFWKDELPQEYLNEIQGKLQYYSVDGRGRISRLLSSFNTRGRLLDSINDDERVVDVMRAWVAFMKTFRLMHLSTVKKQARPLYDDEAPGTSGNPKPGTYLKERISGMNELYERFDLQNPIT